MGFEHHIFFTMSSQERGTIEKLLTLHPFFSSLSTVNEITFYEFRKTITTNNIPDFSVVIEKDGLYVCNNRHSKEWTDINFIKEYLDDNNIGYRIEEL
jgi:hypothetical protein